MDKLAARTWDWPRLSVQLRQDLTDPDVAELDVVRAAVILETDVAFQWPVLHRTLIQLGIDDRLAVEFHLQMVADAGDDHAIPFVRRSRLVGGWGDRADDPTVIMRPEWVCLR